LRAQILGLGSSGAFGEAFSALDQWHDRGSAELKAATEKRVFAMLVRAPDDALFLTDYFERKAEAEGAALPPELQVEISDRLSGLGFPRPAQQILDPETKRSEAGRVALARAALADGDGSSALTHLNGIPGEEASQLRGRALSMLGEHSDALGAFELSGDAEALASAAWRSGNWKMVSETGTEAQKNLVAAYDLIPGDQPHAAPEPNGAEGLIQKSNELLTQSASERQALEQLLKDYSLK